MKTKALSELTIFSPIENKQVTGIGPSENAQFLSEMPDFLPKFQRKCG
jgi:hypothetical protein